jgi:ATP-dependent Clp protease adaptor protein ClpS
MKKEEKIEISFKFAEKHEKANLYQVLVHNDDFTPMEFVIRVLEKFFFLSRAKAAEIMLEAHTKGISACGIFSRDLAESKISQVVEYARDYQHPLLCSMENA